MSQSFESRPSLGRGVEKDVPRIELRDHSPTHFSLICASPIDGYGHVMMGILRTMADVYGALALLDHHGGDTGTEVISISLIETEFAEGRVFDLGARAG